MAPGATLALGLGEIETRSALNQPLRAEIHLLSVRPGEMEDLVVRLAPDALFQRLGIDRSHLLSDLQFEPVTTADGRHVVRVTSRNPIREPFLNFLIEASWPSGRLVREYTVLLDPPTMFERAPPPAPTLAAPVDRRPSAPPTTPRPDTVAAPSTYRVRAGDTMWDLGTRLRPDAGISVEQMMMALLRANPEAFTDNNINNVRSGSVLRVPERDEVMALSAAEARREVAGQHRLWREYRARAAEEAPRPQLPATPDIPPAPPAVSQPDPAPRETDDGRLEIVAESDARSVDGTARLEQDLALLRETSETRRQEGLELRERIRELEDLLERQGRLLALNNQQLAQLQRQLAVAQGEDLDALPVPVSPTAPMTPRPLPPIVTDDPVSAAPIPAPITPAPQPPVTAPAPQPQAAGFLAELLRSPSLLIGGGFGILLILALILLALRRLRGQADAAGEPSIAPEPHYRGQDAVSSGSGATTLATGVAGAGLAAARPASSEATVTAEKAPVDLTSTAMMDTVETQLPAVPASPAAADGAPPEAGSWDEVVNDDTIAEADVYLAYGLYQQAEDLLKEALGRAPDRPDYQFKLAETYFATGNQAAFDETAARMFEQKGDRTSALWDRLVTMGQELSPGNSLYQAGQRTSSLSPPARADDSDLILDAQDLEVSLGEVDFDIHDDMDTQMTGRSDGDDDAPTSLLSGDEDAPTRLQNTGPDDAPTAKPAQDAARVKDEDETLQFALGDLDFEIDDLESDTSMPGPATVNQEDETVNLGLDEQAPSREAGRGTQSPASGNDATVEIDFKDLDWADDDATARIPPEPEDTAGGRYGEADADDTMGLLDDSFTEEDLRNLEDDTEGLEDAFGLGDEVSTKLDLARAYIDMGDAEGARATLEEVLAEGDALQKQEARDLLNQLR
nr:FimV/HubP family polar landmark protein [Ectothiorhodospira lacustris]